jgi:hypothetical protein
MKNDRDNKQNVPQAPSKPWYRTPAVLILLMTVSLILWMASMNYLTLSLDIKPKLLIIKSEGCTYLQLHNIPTKPYQIEHTCTAEVTMTKNGQINISDAVSISIHESQIIATETLPDRPWTPEQHRLLTYLAISTLVFFSIMALILMAF